MTPNRKQRRAGTKADRSFAREVFHKPAVAESGVRFSEDVGVRLERDAAIGDESLTRAVMPAAKLVADKLREIMPLVVATNPDGRVVRTPAVQMPVGGFVVIVADHETVVPFVLMATEGHSASEVIREMIK